MSAENNKRSMPLPFRLFLLTLIVYIPALYFGFVAAFYEAVTQLSPGMMQLIYLVAGLLFLFSCVLVRLNYFLCLGFQFTAAMFFMASLFGVILPVANAADYTASFLLAICGISGIYFLARIQAKLLLNVLESSAYIFVLNARDVESMDDLKQRFSEFEILRNCHPDAPALLDKTWNEALDAFNQSRTEQN